MATSFKRIELKVNADPRLAAGAGGVARCLADAAGIAGEAASQLQSATIAACLQAFEALTPAHPFLQVDYAQYADRLEIVLAHKGGPAPAVGLDSIAGFGTAALHGETTSSAFAGFDRVQYDTRGAEMITRLIKYIGRIGE